MTTRARRRIAIRLFVFGVAAIGQALATRALVHADLSGAFLAGGAAVTPLLATAGALGLRLAAFLGAAVLPAALVWQLTARRVPR